MKYRLTNGILTAMVESLGAELVSLVRDDREYIWQGGEEGLWREHAPILFPICGRLPGGKYSYHGSQYELGLHGFARYKEFDVTLVEADKISLTLRADDDTRRSYPFDFEFAVTYSLDGDKLIQGALVRNIGDETMYTAYGAHPGFALDADMGELSDCYIDFGKECFPERIGLTENGLQTGERTPYSLDKCQMLPLSEGKLGKDGLFLTKTSQSATLLSKKCAHGVKLDFADLPYVGFWRESGERARYLCIEPWCSLPSFDGHDETLENKPDMFMLAPKEEKRIEFSIECF